jgi:class 3 adenylate cyclase/tetratricopeptide (TPR) repeat protein
MGDPENYAVDSAAPREVRKTVTVLFADVAGSTALGDRFDPESMRRVMGRYFDEMRTILELHGGTVEKFIGDAVMAVFGIPFVHDDDPLRAVKAALEMRARLSLLNEELEVQWGVRLDVRMGLNTGEVVAGGPGASTYATGDALNVASRLQQEAGLGEILIGPQTQRFVRDQVMIEELEPLTLKGKALPVAAFRLLGLVSGPVANVRRLDSPMVGRQRERRRLHDAFDQAVADNSCQLFTVLGLAGVGKSRLMQEFFSDLAGQALVISGRCLPYGESITYWPLLEAVREAVGLNDADSPEQARAKLIAVLGDDRRGDVVAQRVAEMIGLAETISGVEDSFDAARALFEALARKQPLVLVFDDIHWGAATFLDLIEHLADWTRGAGILLACMARPELLDARPGWGGGKLNATSVLLEPLSEEECGRLIENLVGEAKLAGEVEARIAEAAEGNPLFVEEMLSMLIDDHLLVREDGSWVATRELATVPVPPTIQALLAARLDRLNPDERAVIERAAVAGKVFTDGAVDALANDALRPAVNASLGSLMRKELIRPEASSPTERRYRFRHLLIRDAAYDSIPKEARAELHEHYARWLDEYAGERATEYEEIIGYHLEHAYRYRAELGPVGESGQALAREAAQRLGAAGKRAFLRKDPSAAVSLISRAVALLPPDDPGRVDLVPNVRAMQGLGGDLGWAQRVLSEAIAAGDERLEAHALVQQALLRLFSDPDVTPHELIEVGERSRRVFEKLEDELGLARAWRLIAQAHYLGRRAGPSVDASEQALIHTRKAGDQLEETETVEWMTAALLLGPTPFPEAIARSQRVLETINGQPVVEVMVMMFLANFLASAGRRGEAQELMERGIRLGEERGESTWFFPSGFGLLTELIDDPVEAERVLTWGYDMQRTSGEKTHFSTITAMLARAKCAQGRLEEADRLTQESESVARANDVYSQILWRATRARVLAQKGELIAAEALARDAVAFAAASDFLEPHGDALMDLAEVLRLAGQPDQAAVAVSQALELYEQKGSVVSAARARSLLQVD